MVNSEELSALFFPLLYAVAALNPETNKNPEKDIDPKYENTTTIIHLSGSNNHQSPVW
jgi:hypothetical protein